MGTLNKIIYNLMFVLDITPIIVKIAIKNKIDLIIVKHSFIFNSLNKILFSFYKEKMCIDLIKNNISVYVSHTNIDIIENGLNDYLLSLINIKSDNKNYLIKTHSIKYKKIIIFNILDKIKNEIKKEILSIKRVFLINCFKINNKFKLIFLYAEDIEEQLFLKLKKIKFNYKIIFSNFFVNYGIGRFGDLIKSIKLDNFIKLIKKKFNLNMLKVISNRYDLNINRVAICCGSGQKFFKD